MLRELSLRDFGVVAASDLELRPGLVALTGETGAGKTMIVAGLGHLLGQRADAGIVRRGAEKAVVRGRWDVNDATEARVGDLGGDVDDGELVTVRQVSASGRSRAVVGGSPAPISALAELELATIHGQSEQQRLAAPDRQRELLDLHARPAGLARYREAFRERQRLVEELTALESDSMERAREADMLRFGLDEIGAVEPRPGEDAELTREQSRLMDLDDLRHHAGLAQLGLSGDATDFEQPSAIALLGEARKALTTLADLDEAGQPLAARAHEAELLVGELAAEVSGYVDSLVADPLRLEHVSARLAALAALTRKYGATVDEVLAWADDARPRLAELDGSDERIPALRARVEELDGELDTLAADISTTRRAAATSLAERAHVELAALAMPHAQLEFAVQSVPRGPHGADRVELRFAANPGQAPGPLGKVASGGELSRVRLALEVVLASEEGHTFVFDEVDAGVGGAVGLEIGRRLQRLATTSQVIVVTHLAQVAAFADQHFVVRKSSDGAVTSSDVHEVVGDDRLVELARMMSGSADSEASLEHAAELLADARRD
ncbi:DNA repair protein RecN [uncultured Tessaracoccus sp.]|uniref:DNA repair protein RecN n=1 Tax=uncultured Tessaracoccus sp. TaxID=905023 RepID=UPI0025FA0289|nr:DNA repair protein RecN [uncultured Tessaracoccus sp.]